MASASDSNLTDIVDATDDASFELEDNTTLNDVDVDDSIDMGDDVALSSVNVEDNADESNDATLSSVNVNDNISAASPVNKTTPKISIKTTKVRSKDTLTFYLKNSKGSPLKSKKLTVNLNNHKYTIKTDSKGKANLKIDLPSKNYKVTVSFNGDKSFNKTSKTFKIKVYKIITQIFLFKNFVFNGKELIFNLFDKKLNSLSNRKLTIRLNGKTYNQKTNGHGNVYFKVNLKNSQYNIKVSYAGDNKYKKYSKIFKFYVVSDLDLHIVNYKLLSKGFLRVSLKDSESISKKTVTLYIDDKEISKKTNSEGSVVFKPNVGKGTYKVKVKMGKYWNVKVLKCLNGRIKDPFINKIPLVNGRPDVDVMPGNYVLSNENIGYTLKKDQYMEVLQRDSHCLYLKKKLTQYVVFKCKYHPNLNHIIKREKWNVLERELNTKLVKANKNGYWPSDLYASLKGRSYTYPEVRDPQDTKYTCGPTSCSVCSQVLKNYLCESYLAYLSGSKPVIGTSCNSMQSALQKHNFVCYYFFKNSFDYALNELKKGGCALIFHADNHYVTIIDISDDGKKVLVSNSYGSFDNIPTKWLDVSYMRNKFCYIDESLIVKLNYKLSDSRKNTISHYYNNFGTNWQKHNVYQGIGWV